MKIVLCLFLAMMPLTPLVAAESPYSGQEHRLIKSLSDNEIRSLESGDGMGFAKLAELNGYPGPKHVLELSTELNLSPEQLTESEALHSEMRDNAVSIGNELIAAEMALDRAFADGSIDAASLDNRLRRIGELHAQLRYVHLEAHLRQKDLLTDAQVDAYDKARGYHRRQHDHDDGKRLYAVQVTVGPNWDTDKAPNEQAYFKQHSDNLKKLRSAGHIVLGARYSNIGLVIFSAASAADVRAFMDRDPSMNAGTFQYEVHPFNVFYAATSEKLR
ncbi:MAG: YciI family protein [Acidiferrobacterales bacterium]|nr:YciI family protein [Acidiferrobacterales bacterium]